MSDKDPAAVQSEIAALRARIAQLEEETAQSPPPRDWTKGQYPTYYATTGFFLGMFAALSSFVLNVVGSLIVGQDPLQLIKVYLTFGLGARALDPAFDDSMALAVGCCLYIATGMFLGIVFQVVLSRTAGKAGLAKRLFDATLLALIVWVVNFYLLIAWLQPLMFGGRWILTEIPWWVAALTHLVFGWTMALVYPLGAFEPYRLQTEKT